MDQILYKIHWTIPKFETEEEFFEFASSEISQTLSVFMENLDRSNKYCPNSEDTHSSSNGWWNGIGLPSISDRIIEMNFNRVPQQPA